jgi:hypothetical protein
MRGTLQMHKYIIMGVQGCGKGTHLIGTEAGVRFGQG